MPFNISTASDGSWAVAEGWIRRCFTNHKLCAAVTDSPHWYPTRLLKIVEDSVKLIETSEETPTGPYVTLSHCWGKAQFLTLKQIISVSSRNLFLQISLQKHFKMRSELRNVSELTTSGLTPFALSRIRKRTGCKKRRLCTRSTRTVIAILQQLVPEIALTVSSSEEIFANYSLPRLIYTGDQAV